MAAILASGRYCTVSPSAPSTPPAFTLSGKRVGSLRQGIAGNCWVNSACQLAATSANALGYESFAVSRRFVGYVATRSYEGGGNPADGGDPTDAITAMTTAQGGAGAPHESLYPYFLASDNNAQMRAALAATPPAEVYADAVKSHLVSPVVIKSDSDAMVMISQGHGVCNGIWWPYGWDGPHTAMETIGFGEYGHSLYEMGYVKAGVWPDRYGEYDWWHLDNWHGDLYPPLPKAFADLVPGYDINPGPFVSHFWVRGDVYRTVQAKGQFLRVSATDVTGFARNIVVPSAVGTLVF